MYLYHTLNLSSAFTMTTLQESCCLQPLSGERPPKENPLPPGERARMSSKASTLLTARKLYHQVKFDRVK